MLDVDTFLTTLYVMVDDLCQSHPTEQRRPGPRASLCQSEVITLSIFARWSRFASERDFYRYAEAHLRGAFPTLPDRSQFNRLVRFYTQTIEEIAVKLGEMLEDEAHPYQALDSSAMPVRDAKRRGHGWLAGEADIGWSNSIGWYEGFSLLAAIEPSGVITGFCFGSASTADQPLAETFFAVRANPNPRLISVGSAFSGTYVADKGFEGVENHRRWLECYGAEVDPSAQAQLQKAKLVQALEAVDRLHPSDRRDRLRQALQRLRPVAGAAPRDRGFASAAGGEGGSAQLRECRWRRPPAGLTQLHKGQKRECLPEDLSA